SSLTSVYAPRHTAPALLTPERGLKHHPLWRNALTAAALADRHGLRDGDRYVGRQRDRGGHDRQPHTGVRTRAGLIARRPCRLARVGRVGLHAVENRQDR